MSHTKEKREQPGELIALVRKQLADLSKTVETCAVASGARDDKFAEFERENTELHNKVKERSQEILHLRMKLRQADNARSAEEKRKERLLAERNDFINSMEKQLKDARALQLPEEIRAKLREADPTKRPQVEPPNQKGDVSDIE